jgi:myosin heavy subunit
MKAQHGVELEAKTLESRAMEKELAQLRLERTAMLEHTANMAQRHTRKVTEGGDDRRRVLELQRKVETQGETIQSLLEMKNRLLEQMQGRQNIGGREDTTPPDLMGSLDPRHVGASVPGTQQRDAAAAADSFRTANSSGGADSESLRHELQEERARADREARSVRLLRQELAGLHGDISDLRQQLLEAQNANLQYERAAWSAVGQDQSTGVAAQQQVSILQQENNELLERLQEMSGHIQQLSAQNTLLAQKSSGGRPPVATQTAGATPRDEANPQTTSAR